MSTITLKDESDNTITLPKPSNPTRKFIRKEGVNRTLGGELKVDTNFEKYQYVFNYPDMVATDYNSIVSFVDSATTLYLTWDGRYGELLNKQVKVWVGGQRDEIGEGQLISTNLTIEPIQ